MRLFIDLYSNNPLFLPFTVGSEVSYCTVLLEQVKDQYLIQRSFSRAVLAEVEV